MSTFKSWLTCSGALCLVCLSIENPLLVSSLDQSIFHACNLVEKEGLNIQFIGIKLWTNCKP